MIRRSGERYFLNLAASTIFLLLLMALTSCGTLDISLDPTPEPAQAGASPESGDVLDPSAENAITRAKTTESPTSWGPLVSYVHTRYGYEILVPENAEVMEPEPGGRLTSFSNLRAEGHVIQGGLTCPPPRVA